MKHSLPWESVPPPIYPAQSSLTPRKQWVQTGGWILVVVLLLFGKGRFSDMMGDVAKGIKSFKKGMAEDETPPATPKQIEGQRAPDGAPVATPTAEHDKR